LAERIKALGGDQAQSTQAAGGPGAPGATTGAAGGDILKIGEDQWQLQECYNCHKLRGEGGKKRGPELDNIGSYMTVEDIKEKVLDPRSWMAEGFEKEYEKKKMPDKYKDLMEEKDVVALATWLVTFKNTSVNTPKPIKKK
jgi:mono/diheme cytochrome c family protein